MSTKLTEKFTYGYNSDEFIKFKKYTNKKKPLKAYNLHSEKNITLKEPNMALYNK